VTALIHGALWYGGLGAVALAVCRLITWVRTRKDKDNFVSSLMRSLEPARLPWVNRLRTVGLWVLVLFLWPLAVGIAVSDLIGEFRRSRRPQRKVDPEDRFFAKGHLIEEVSVAVAESQERHTDPLGYVPAQPFGHLHLGWKRFLEHQPDGAVLWSFHRPTDDKLKWSFDRANGTARGYCWVADGKVVGEFIAER